MYEPKRLLARRELLALLAFASASGPSGRVQAQTKATQQDAEYQPTPKNGLACDVCAQFRPPRACEIVEGDINPKGWCKFFDMPD